MRKKEKLQENKDKMEKKKEKKPLKDLFEKKVGFPNEEEKNMDGNVRDIFKVSQLDVLKQMGEELNINDSINDENLLDITVPGFAEELAAQIDLDQDND